MLRTKFGDNNTAVDQGFFCKVRARVPVLFFLVFKEGVEGFTLKIRYFYPVLVKFSV